MSVSNVLAWLCYAAYIRLPWRIARRRWVERVLLPGAGRWAYGREP